ncbi:GMP reductase 1 [Galemys pyrenaicus]|uniref:GMP reductase n=1 Tax=Galemys pyrenaicus TaxID=202257 RepID=A0A8J6DK06_GALPY|nr:GMP reductase 1 [Galemys pyrenaicus]
MGPRTGCSPGYSGRAESVRGPLGRSVSAPRPASTRSGPVAQTSSSYRRGRPTSPPALGSQNVPAPPLPGRPRPGPPRLAPPRPSRASQRPPRAGAAGRSCWRPPLRPSENIRTMPRIDADLKLDFKDVLLRPKRSSLKSRSEVDLERTFTFRNSKQTYSGIPIIVANMDTVGTFEMAVVMAQCGAVLCSADDVLVTPPLHARVQTQHSMFTAIHKHYTLDDWKLFAMKHPECLQHIAVSSGSGKNDLEKMSSILEAVPQVRFICLDVANGYSEHFVEFVKLVRAKFPEHTIMEEFVTGAVFSISQAGNVVTGEMVEELILSGADIIKVGVGPGSVCTTRTKTGVGYPQLSAVIECADSAHGLKGHIISDGGCTCPGDVAKAFGAGADFVMLGGMFSGHTECAGEVIEKNGQKLKLFYGMSSETAMKKHAGGVAEYRASEGKTVEVPYKGDVENTILDILGGLRSTCTYVGAAKLKELSRRATFIRVTQQHNTVFS